MLHRTVVLLGACLAVSPCLAAAPTTQPPTPPGSLQSITLQTGREKDGTVTLAGRDASQQLLVTGQYSTGRLRDLTTQVEYETTPTGIVSVDRTGLLTPRKEGKTLLKATAPGGKTAQLTILVHNLVHDVPVSFTNQVVPIFTKFGCNAGGCHGKADGQNGFKLSLLGFEPQEDYEYLVKEDRGRRLFPAAPDHSLLLRKATGRSAHGGGKRLDPDTPYYRVLRRWIEQGAPYGETEKSAVVRLEVLPRDRILERGAQQQLLVIAHHADGSTSDVTRMTQLEANVPEMAEVSATGRVTIKQLAGSAAIMARYQAHVDVFHATVPLGAPVERLPAPANFIDELVFKRLQELGLPPSPRCDDGTFLRRATIDLAGRLPTLEETRQFLADSSPTKRAQLIDRLLASEDYADYFANKWGAILRNRRRSSQDSPEPTLAFHQWIRTSLKDNRPYDQFVRDILTAKGEATKSPPVIWYREVKDPSAQLEDVAQLFLGQRLACARCHHHPFEKWSQEDYYGFAAFFSQVVVKDPPPPKKPKKGQPEPPKEPFSVAHRNGVAQATNIRTGKPVRPTGLGGKPLDLGAAIDPREKLVDWMVQKDNPFFARTLVNRYWKHFFGRGLVDPEDDMRLTNPASNPELLDALARDFIANKYDLKKLIRTLCTSQVYQLSALPNAYNASDRQNFSRYLPRRLHAEVLLDAIDTVTLSPSNFKGAPRGVRAVQLPDNLVESYFLSVFGRPDSASACECERNSDASLAQALHMFNSQEMLNKVSGPRASNLARDKRPHEERLRDLYLLALSREPSKEELTTLVNYIQKKDKNVQSAYEDILFALINTKEFLFNH